MRTLRFFDSIDLRWMFGLRVGTKTEEGGALVELALTMPVLVLLLVGAAELGWVTYASDEVANAARAGVSYGCQTSNTAADTVGIQNTAIEDAPDITLGTTTATLSCSCSNGSALGAVAANGGCLPSSCSTGQPETILTVQTQASVTPVLHLPGLPPSFTLHGQAIQKVMQ
jgi:Flp pilus assembly protein TadG